MNDFDMNEFQKMRDEVKTLKKRLDWLQQAMDSIPGTDTGIDPEEQTVVTDVQIDAANLQFEKKTRTAICQWTSVETGWTEWHLGVSCPTVSQTEQAAATQSAQYAETIALLKLTGAI